MKFLIAVLMLCAALCLLCAGCTTPTPPATPTPTATATPLPTVTPVPPVTDPQLLGSWTLGEMGTQGGKAILNMFPAPITITFYSQGSLNGYGGCNNYQAPYTLTGSSGPFGKQINIGPITSTLKYCTDTGSLELTYLQILDNASAYSIDTNSVLSLRDPSGSTLVFRKS